MSKKTKGFLYFIAIGCLTLFLMILVSSVIEIGERLRNIHFGVEIAFYLIAVLIFFFAIVNPIIIILKSPSLSIATTLDDDSYRKLQIYKAVANNIRKNNDLPIEEIKLLTNYENKNELVLNLQVVFDKSVKKQINEIILRNARIVMVSTAVCQSARFDMLTVFSVNLKMIKEIVVKCGYRPSMANLSKLTANVFGTALIAEGLESLSIDDVLPTSVSNSLGEIPFIKPVISSITQGIANSLLTIRIGIITRKYLFKDGYEITKESIRKEAFRESLKLIPLVIAETLTFFPKKMVKLFTRKPKEETDKNEIIVSAK